LKKETRNEKKKEEPKKNSLEKVKSDTRGLKGRNNRYKLKGGTDSASVLTYFCGVPGGSVLKGGGHTR